MSIKGDGKIDNFRILCYKGIKKELYNSNLHKVLVSYAGSKPTVGFCYTITSDFYSLKNFLLLRIPWGAVVSALRGRISYELRHVLVLITFLRSSSFLGTL